MFTPLRTLLATSAVALLAVPSAGCADLTAPHPLEIRAEPPPAPEPAAAAEAQPVAPNPEQRMLDLRKAGPAKRAGG